MKLRKLTNYAMATTLLTSISSFNMAFAEDIEDAEDNTVIQTTAQEAEDDEPERITVTGSRLRRDEFTAISPVQIIDAADGRAIGLSDTTAIIAENPVVTGAQLDGSINSGAPTAAVEGVPVNGPGAQTVALRGLGAERTLLLINGRRVGPAGVRGAPVAPDLNLLPSTMIDRIEILTDGASSVYGADAVAGVANLILRDDFEGFEVGAFASVPEMGGGETIQINFIGGASSDRGQFTVAGEFYEQTAIMLRDRTDWSPCLQDIEVGQNTGNIYSACLDGRPDNGAFVIGTGFLYNTPGMSDSAFPDWSTSAAVTAMGQNRRANPLYSLQDEELNTQLREEVQRMNIFASGSYDIDLFSRDTLYFELLYSTRNSVGRFTNEQAFPGIPAFIPMEDSNGNLLVNPDGSLQLFDNPLNPFTSDALPVYSNNNLAQRRASDVSFFRSVFGLGGDIPGLEDSNWTYELTAIYDRSYGVASQPIMNEFAVREAVDTLRFDASGNLTCGLDRAAPGFGFLTPLECVPVNFFGSNLFETQGGDKFFTEEEAAFLFADSINTTEIEQAYVGAFFTGDLFEMPAGTVGLVFGGEFREQRIATVNDYVRVTGTAASEIPDTEPNTNGRTSLAEFFAETEIPVTDTFTFNVAGRYTEEENFGGQVTYSTRADWQATETLRLRATYGTSFRAPNLREQFLAGGTATIAGGADPCLVPTAANNGGVYNAAADTRSANLLANCVADGVDPTALGLLATTGITVRTGGNTDLQAETSESLTAGFVYSNTFGDDIDFDLAVTYFDIEVEDTVEESNANQLIANCYNGAANLGDPACAFIERQGTIPAQNTIAVVNAGFINVGLISSTGLDYNARLNMPADFIRDGADLSFRLNAAQYLESLQQIDPTSAIDDNVGEIGNPEWLVQFSTTLSLGDWSARWRARYQSDGQQDNSDAFRAPPAAPPADPSNACDFNGANEPCRDVDFVDDYFVHDIGVSYEADMWNFSAGINNVFNEEPPLIDQGEGPSRMNIVTQSGYDLFGRRIFANVTRRF